MTKLLDPTYDNKSNLISKRCRICLEIKSVQEYNNHGYCNGKKQTQWICKQCFSIVCKPKNEQQRSERQNPIFRPKYILKDTKATDRNMGFSNDLTIEWIAKCIKDGCCYCGNKTLQMSLDRIDNNLPHTKNNVKPACIRCNFIRKTMPYNAWLQLLPGLQQAEEQGLFEEWTGTFDRNNKRYNGRKINQEKPRFS
jgi:hypothetical protein